MSASPTISIIVPVYNEARCLPAFLRELTNNLAEVDWNYRLLFVDDGSTDGTWSVLEAMQEEHPVSAIRLSRNFGKEAALCAGLEQAEGDAFITIDADLQHPPELIPKMVEEWRESGCHLVEAVKDRASSEPALSKFQANLFYRTFAFLCDTNIEGHTDFKLLSSTARDAWMRLPERSLFFRGLTNWLGFERKRVRFTVPDIVGRDSRWTSIGLLKYAVKNITAFSSLPLVLLLVAGVLLLIPAVLLCVWALYLKLIGLALGGFTTVILLMCFFGGLQFLGLALLGLYVAQVYNEVKGRPRYIIADRIKDSA